MKVLNKTDYDTNTLRKLFTKCLNEQSKIEGKLQEWQIKKLKVHVKYARKDFVSGRAIVNGSTVWMFLPKSKHTNGTPMSFVQNTAYVFLHELGHIRGFKHRKMYEQSFKEMAKTFSPQYSIVLKQPVEKPKEDIQVKRYTRIIQIISEKTTKLKRLQNQLKKYNVKKKYYERVLAQSGKL